MARFSQDTRHDGMATIGIDYAMKTIELHGERVLLQIWDTAGQVRTI